MSTYKEQLSHYTKKELITLARIHHIQGYSKLNKTELAEKVLQILSKEETMLPLFLYLSKEETSLFTSLKPTKDFCLTRRLSMLGYCFLTGEHTYVVPDNLSVSFLFSADFQKKQEEMSLLMDVLSMGSMLYGCMPVSILTSIYCRYTNSSVTAGQIKKMVSKIPDCITPMILLDDLLIQKEVFAKDLYKKIQKCQGTISYYIPPKETCIHFARYGYFNDSSTNRLALYLTKNLKTDSYKTRDILTKVQSIFRQGGSLLDATEYLKKEYLFSEDIPNKTLMILLNNMFAQTRLLLNRGYTELEKINLYKTKKIKISPNSLCPCGSGKKYKKCCGKQ